MRKALIILFHIKIMLVLSTVFMSQIIDYTTVMMIDSEGPAHTQVGQECNFSVNCHMLLEDFACILFKELKTTRHGTSLKAIMVTKLSIT